MEQQLLQTGARDGQLRGQVAGRRAGRLREGVRERGAGRGQRGGGQGPHARSRAGGAGSRSLVKVPLVAAAYAATHPPLCSGRSIGEPSPLGCRRGAVAASGACPKSLDRTTAFDLAGGRGPQGRGDVAADQDARGGRRQQLRRGGAGIRGGRAEGARWSLDDPHLSAFSSPVPRAHAHCCTMHATHTENAHRDAGHG
eukprot:scaffold51315_cov60-Phaeocystis_antarctica.AAC.3